MRSCCGVSGQNPNQLKIDRMGFFGRIRESLTRTKQQIVGRFEEIVRQADEPERLVAWLRDDDCFALLRDSGCIGVDLGLEWLTTTYGKNGLKRLDLPTYPLGVIKGELQR